MGSELQPDAAFAHVIVVGAGAIGSLYAAKLSNRCDVTVIARSAHVEAIERDGLRVVGVETFTARVRASATVEAVPPRTLVLLTTKVNDNDTAASMLAPLVGDDTVVLCVQNGLGSETIVKQAFARQGASHVVVLRAITQFGAIFRDAGSVDYKVAGHTLIERHPRSAAIAALLSAAGLAGRVSDTIASDIWRKLIFNCVINPITSITGTEVGGIADPRLDPLKQLVVDECLAVARAEGVTFAIDFLEALTDVFGASRNLASMRQDLLKSKPTEIDHMNGAVAALGARYGIPCPVNRALTAIIHSMEGRK
jgi:2-dehydropantoate 2-reductase